jgi:hypothetical protein
MDQRTIFVCISRCWTSLQINYRVTNSVFNLKYSLIICAVLYVIITPTYVELNAELRGNLFGAECDMTKLIWEKTYGFFRSSNSPIFVPC